MYTDVLLARIEGRIEKCKGSEDARGESRQDRTTAQEEPDMSAKQHSRIPQSSVGEKHR